MRRPKKEKQKKKTPSTNLRLLNEEEIKEFEKYTELYVCMGCGKKPQIIERIHKTYSLFDEYEFVDKKHKCYCPDCQKGTGFSESDYRVIENWNKMMQPPKYEDCHVYSFHPIIDERDGYLLDEFNYKFDVFQSEIIQGKGRERFLYYLFENQERKLDLDRFVDGVTIYQKSSFGTFYDFEREDICVVIAENEKIAKLKLNKKIKDEMEQKHQHYLKMIDNRKDELKKAEENLVKFEKYLKEIKIVKEK